MGYPEMYRKYLIVSIKNRARRGVMKERTELRTDPRASEQNNNSIGDLRKERILLSFILFLFHMIV